MVFLIALVCMFKNCVGYQLPGIVVTAKLSLTRVESDKLLIGRSNGAFAFFLFFFIFFREGRGLGSYCFDVSINGLCLSNLFLKWDWAV